METNWDVGKVLVRLNNRCYEKGMKNVSISLKGIRNDKIAGIDRKIVVPQIIKSKDYSKFLTQFLNNISDEIEQISALEKVKKIVKDPKCNYYTYESCDINLLYLYLLSLNDEKYNDILKELLNLICGDNKKNVLEENPNRELNEIKELCQLYEKKIEKLKTTNFQRKLKIKELEKQCNILTENNRKLNLYNEELIKSLEEEKQLASNNEARDVEVEKDNPKKALIVKKIISDILDRYNIDLITVEEFLALEKMQINTYTKILVYKKNIPIGKLRKIKILSGEKAIYFESKEDVYNYLNTMEEKNENRSN